MIAPTTSLDLSQGEEEAGHSKDEAESEEAERQRQDRQAPDGSVATNHDRQKYADPHREKKHGDARDGVALYQGAEFSKRPHCRSPPRRGRWNHSSVRNVLSRIAA